jgi:hypothetical protein
MTGLICIHITPEFKLGDPPPAGYLAWSEWAEVQMKAGLKQRRCWKCGLWRFPQETCCGPEPPDRRTAFTVDDVISGRVKLDGPLGEKVARILERHARENQ